MSSTPTLSEFDPKQVRYQYKVLRDIRKNYVYETYNDAGKRDTIHHEVLLSGSVGSAKSILLAHIAVTHCLFYARSRVCIGRKAMPDLKSTLFQMIFEHLQDENLVEGRDYWVNLTASKITFKNGSELISRSWADKKFKKARSLALSCLIIEELTENETDEAYKEFSMRVNRLPHVPEQLIVCATNPDSPSHWAYKYFMDTPSPTRHVYYSVTTDNPFLPDSYVKKLKQDLDPKMYERMVLGRWIDIAGETVYHQWDERDHWVDDWYQVDTRFPVYFTWDFNVGEGKPMSVIFYQYIGDTFHFFTEAVVQGARTQSTLDELFERKVFDIPSVTYYLQGDASGTAQSANSNFSNYEIIEQNLKRMRVRYEYDVPRSNPPIKTRHNDVNGYLKNVEGQVRMKFYSKSFYMVNERRFDMTGCPVAKEGMALTKLKPGGQYIEDDSKAYQHVTTAVGYGVSWIKLSRERGRSTQVR